MTDREILLKKLSSYQFIIDDLQLYLDTHPKDRRTLLKINELTEAMLPIREAYEKAYGPLLPDDGGTNKWKWVKSPWPWEKEEND